MELDMIMKSSLFKEIKKEDMPHLLHCLHAYTKTYSKDDWILQRGDVIHHLGLLIEGKALIVKDDFWGNRSIISDVESGGLFAETYACIAGKALEVSLVAVDECTVLFLDIEYITNICEHACSFHRRIMKNLLMIASSKNLFLTQKMDHITKRTTRDKILSYLSSQAFEKGTKILTIPFDRQQLADYLSVERSALSYELGKMKRDGLILYHKNHFEML